jgi:cytochrome o ubiquinol oxidase subunit 2
MKKKYKIIGVAVPVLAFLAVAAWYLHRTNIPVLEPRGPIAQQEQHLIIITLSLSLIVVVPVFSLLFGFAWKYREGNPKQAKYSPDLAGNRIAETIWWLVPSALILVIGIIIWNSSHALDPWKPLDSSTSPVTIQVVALDWKWLFIYPQQGIASVNFMQIPRQTPVDFEITSDSVMNSFWIPQLGSQIYAMPGMSTQLHLLASSDGNYYGSSANISGDGFAGMNFIAKASSQDDFDRWVNSAKHSPDSLSQAAYAKLAKPSQNNPVAYYASGAPGLYDTIINKYLAPIGGSSSMSGMGASNMSGMSGMSGMEMQ